MIWLEVWSAWQEWPLKWFEPGLPGQGQGRQCSPEPSTGFPKNPSTQLGRMRHSASVWQDGWREVQTVTERFLPLTEVSCCVVPAVFTLPGAGVTEVCVAITLTGAAAGEAPLTWLAVWALTPRGSLPALALACNWVTLVAHGALWVAVTGWKGGGI